MDNYSALQTDLTRNGFHHIAIITPQTLRPETFRLLLPKISWKIITTVHDFDSDFTKQSLIVAELSSKNMAPTMNLVEQSWNHRVPAFVIGRHQKTERLIIAPSNGSPDSLSRFDPRETDTWLMCLRFILQEHQKPFSLSQVLVKYRQREPNRPPSETAGKNIGRQIANQFGLT